MPKNDWNEYKKLILFEMQENGKRFQQITTVLDALKNDVSGLKVKAALAGGAAGIIGTAVVTTVVSLWH